MISQSDVLLVYGCGVATGAGVTLAVTLIARLKRKSKRHPNLVRVDVGPEDQFAGELETLRATRFSPPMKKPRGPRVNVIREGSDRVRYLNEDGTVTDE